MKKEEDFSQDDLERLDCGHPAQEPYVAEAGEMVKSILNHRHEEQIQMLRVIKAGLLSVALQAKERAKESLIRAQEEYVELFEEAGGK